MMKCSSSRDCCELHGGVHQESAWELRLYLISSCTIVAGMKKNKILFPAKDLRNGNEDFIKLAHSLECPLASTNDELSLNVRNFLLILKFNSVLLLNVAPFFYMLQ